MTTIGGGLVAQLALRGVECVFGIPGVTPSSYIGGGNISDNGNIDISNWGNVRAILVWCQKVLH